MPITNQTYYNPALVTAPKIDIDLLWLLTIVFLGLAAIYFVSVFFFRNKISSQSSKTRLRKKELSPMVSEFLFYEDDVDKTEKSRYIDLKIQIRELIKDDFNRKVLTEILLDLRKDVSGDTQKRLFNLYQDLGLEKDAFKKLTSWRWEVISKGISHLTQMQVTSAYTFITKFINHRRGTIRKQAEIATVSLKPEGINYFLDTTRYKISEWQQLKLLDVLRNQEDFDPPRFKMWLTSTNKYVVLFALRLIKYYNQNDANSSLIELVKHKNNQIKTEALSCIKEFHVVKAIPLLKQVVHKGNTEVKIAMLGTIGSLGSTADIEFLQQVAKREGNFSVKSKAFAAINIIAPETIMPTKGIEIITNGREEDSDIEENEAFGPTENVDSQTDLNHIVDGEESTLAADKEIVSNEFDTVDETKPKLIEQKVKEIQKIEDKANGDGTVPIERTIGEESKIEDEFDEHPAVTAEDFIEENPKIEGEVNTDEAVSVEETIKEALETDEVENLNTPIHAEGQTLEDEEEATENKQVTNGDYIQDDQAHFESSLALESPVQDTIQEKTSDTKDDETTQHFDFLPIVTENESQPDQPLEKYRPMANFNGVNKDLKYIEVDFEEVIITKVDKEIEPKTADFDVAEIDFLPLVVDIDKSEIEATIESPEDTNALSPLDMEVHFEELPKQPMDAELHDLVAEINELDFLPIVTGEETEPANDQEKDAEPLPPENTKHIEGYTLSDFEVDFEETSVQEEDAVSFDLDDTLIIDDQGPSVDDVMSWLMAHNELREIEIQYETVSFDKDEKEINNLIPEPIYYDKHEGYMMGLLDDLEELGDYREIPFLEELLVVEKKSFIRDRINHIVSRFLSHTDNRKAYKMHGNEKTVLPVFSVFADLFKNIDTECKLILLDEVVAVGNEKEIPFLDGLLEDPHPEIRKKAQVALKLLVAKISDNDSDNNPKKKQVVEELPTRVFDWQIPSNTKKEQQALDLENPESDSETKSQIDPEIMEIDFQLAEVLDNGYSSEILNLPVIATEISPNGASLIFQLNNMIRKFNG